MRTSTIVGPMAFRTCTRHPNHINHPLQIPCQLSIALVAPSLNPGSNLIFEISIEPFFVPSRYFKQLSVDVVNNATFFSTAGLQRGRSRLGQDCVARWR